MISQAFVALTALSAPLALAARPSPGGALSTFTGDEASTRQLLTAMVEEGANPRASVDSKLLCDSSRTMLCSSLACLQLPQAYAACGGGVRSCSNCGGCVQTTMTRWQEAEPATALARRVQASAAHAQVTAGTVTATARIAVAMMERMTWLQRPHLRTVRVFGSCRHTTALKFCTTL